MFWRPRSAALFRILRVQNPDFSEPVPSVKPSSWASSLFGAAKVLDILGDDGFGFGVKKQLRSTILSPPQHSSNRVTNVLFVAARGGPGNNPLLGGLPVNRFAEYWLEDEVIAVPGVIARVRDFVQQDRDRGGNAAVRTVLKHLESSEQVSMEVLESEFFRNDPIVQPRELFSRTTSESSIMTGVLHFINVGMIIIPHCCRTAPLVVTSTLYENFHIYQQKVR